MPAGDIRNLVEAVVNGIGPHAIGDRLELSEVFIDLARIDGHVRSERVLPAPERGIGDAVQLFAGSKRRLRHFDRRSEPGPAGNNRRRRKCEQRSGNPSRHLPGPRSNTVSAYRSAANVPSGSRWWPPRLECPTNFLRAILATAIAPALIP